MSVIRLTFDKPSETWRAHLSSMLSSARQAGTPIDEIRIHPSDVKAVREVAGTLLGGQDVTIVRDAKVSPGEARLHVSNLTV